MAFNITSLSTQNVVLLGGKYSECLEKNSASVLDRNKDSCYTRTYVQVLNFLLFI